MSIAPRPAPATGGDAAPALPRRTGVKWYRWPKGVVMVRAMIMKGYGPPDVLVTGEVEVGEPGPGQIRVAVKCAGVGPTDLEVRAGHLQAVYPLDPGAVLGFEASGVVETV